MKQPEKTLVQYMKEDLQPSRRSWTCRVVRSFFIKTHNGPPECAQIGDVVKFYERDLVNMLFCSDKILPIDPPVPKEAEYMVLTPFVATVNAEFKELAPSDLVSLNQDEAIPLLKTRHVTPINAAHFTLHERS